MAETLSEQFAAFQRHAKKECACCQGRKYGDCAGLHCRYFRITASPSELEEAKRGDTGFKVKGFHLSWNGPRHGSLDTV